MHDSQSTSTDTQEGHIVRDLLREALASLRRKDGVSAEHYILKAWKIVGPTEDTLRVGGLAPWQVKRLRAFLEIHFCDEVTVHQASQLISRSASRFCRAFRVSFGCSFHQYLIRLRLQRACRLMLTTEAPLSEIALECGLADQAHFSRRFKSAFGEPPAVWRRRYGERSDTAINSREIAEAAGP